MQQNEKSSIKALVLYHSLFGNTKIVAESLAKDVKLDDISNYDFVALGSPTHNTGVPKEVKVFLEALGCLNLTKTYFFAFETRYKMFLNDPRWKRFENSAAKNIEQVLTKFSYKIIYPRASAIVKKKQGPLSLEAGTDFLLIGSEIASLLKQQMIENQNQIHVINQKTIEINI
jgi:flavorubredoxin